MPLRVREEIINFHAGREALTLLHISDIHVWFSKGILEKLRAIIFENDPELVIFTGDYFDVPRGAFLFRNFLREVSATYTIIFIRGNHDFLYGQRIADLLVGIPNCFCVENTVHAFVSQKGFGYHITSWQQRQQLKNNTSCRNIVLLHNPEQLQEEELESIDLVLAGHLHGGQFILFQTASKAYFPGSLLYRYCTDRKQLNGTTLVISKGVGDTLPLRFNCAREVVKIRIM